MNAFLSLKKALLLCTVVLLCLTFTSWKSGSGHGFKAVQDTVPAKHEKKIVDLDEALENLDNAKDDLEKSIRDIDWEKMNADLKESMKDLDVELKHMNEDLKSRCRKWMSKK